MFLLIFVLCRCGRLPIVTLASVPLIVQSIKYSEWVICGGWADCSVVLKLRQTGALLNTRHSNISICLAFVALWCAFTVRYSLLTFLSEFLGQKSNCLR